MKTYLVYFKTTTYSSGSGNAASCPFAHRSGHTSKLHQNDTCRLALVFLSVLCTASVYSTRVERRQRRSGAESGVQDCLADNLPLSFPAVETADRVSREGIAVGHVRQCVCFNFQLYHFAVSLCDAVVVCPSVCSNKPVLCRNNWTNRAGIWHGCFLPPVHTAIMRYINNLLLSLTLT